MPLAEKELCRQSLDTADSLDSLCELVLRRFGRAYPIPVAISRMDGHGDSVWVNGTEVPRLHPTCQACKNHIACEMHREKAPSFPRDGNCAGGHLVAFVPMHRNGDLSAVFQLVEPNNIPRASLRHRVDLLADLIAESTSSSGDSNPDLPPKQALTATVASWWRPARASVHPQVQRAMGYVEEHLSDPRTNVGTVARMLGINATYLSHIFSEEMGTRMSRYIAGRRVQVAKKLLATTDWQIKRVAFESGHNNADWFSQVFHSHTGMTPCAYRRHARSNQIAE